MTVDESAQSHWNGVYEQKATDEVSWWQDPDDVWIDLVEAVAPAPEARIIDVGAGASVLVDQLVSRGWPRVTVLDLAASAFDAVKQRLGAEAHLVDFVVDDVRTFRSPTPFDVWHDRAVLHFLTNPDDVEAYRASMVTNLAPQGFAVIAVFAPDGPDQCSGLPVARYSADELQKLFAADFTLVDAAQRIHVTPWGATQSFTVVTLQRTG